MHYLKYYELHVKLIGRFNDRTHGGLPYYQRAPVLPRTRSTSGFNLKTCVDHLANWRLEAPPPILKCIPPVMPNKSLSWVGAYTVSRGGPLQARRGAKIRGIVGPEF